MATVTMKRNLDFVGRCLALASDRLNLPMQHIGLDYDEEADVLYISLRRPQRATKTIEMDDDILVRKDGGKIVGVTMLNASSRRSSGRH